MTALGEAWSPEGLSRSLDEARGAMVAAIQRRLQQFLLEPDMPDLMTIAASDVSLLLDEVARLQGIRRRLEARTGGAGPTNGSQGGGPPVPAAGQTQTPAPSAWESAVETLQAALGQGADQRAEPASA